MAHHCGRCDTIRELALPRHTTLRVASILVTALVAGLCSDSATWKSLVFSLGFSHYFMALYYSKHQVTRVLGQSMSYLPLAIVLAAGGLLYWRDFSLVMYFAIHHVCNEVYLLKYSSRVEAHPEMTRLRTSSLFLNLFIYLVILQDHRELRFLDPGLLFSGLALSAVTFVYFLTRVRSSMTRHELIDASAFELIGFLLIGLSFFVQITFLQIVFYHFVFWIFFPMEKIRSRGNGEFVRYLGLTAGLTALFVSLSPVGFAQYPLYQSLFFTQFMLWSYIHITISYALSSSHPDWITRWFKPQQVIQSSALP